MSTGLSKKEAILPQRVSEWENHMDDVVSGQRLRGLIGDAPDEFASYLFGGSAHRTSILHLAQGLTYSLEDVVHHSSVASVLAFQRHEASRQFA